MIKCLRIRKKLLPYLDNVLSDRDRMRVQEHLKTCVNCREKLKSLKEVGDLLAKKTEVERSNDYWQEFQSKLRHRLTPHYKPEISIFERMGDFLKPKPVFAVCSVLLILIVTGILMKQQNLVRFHQNQTVQLQARLEKLEKENYSQAAQLALLERIVHSPRCQMVVLQKQNPVTGKGEPYIFHRETIPINNLKEFQKSGV